MRRSGACAAGVLALLVAGSGGPVEAAGEEGKPLPVDRTQKVMADKGVFTVEGRVRVPKGVEISVFKDITIKAKGSAPAVIEVEGGFDAIGVFGREVIFENVTVEPQAKYERIHMDMAIFRKGGGIRTPAKDVAVDGYILLENFDAVQGAAVDLLYQTGTIEMSSACADGTTRIRTRKPEGASKDQVRIFIRGCHEDSRHKCSPHGGRVGLVGGLEVDGGDDVTIQLGRSGGALTAIRNWGQRLIFDGMKVDSGRLEFTHRDAGAFPRVQCAKCDISSTEVVARSPVDAKTRDTLLMDRCWFKGITDPKEVLDKVVKDAADDPKNGARVTLNKVGDRPLELGGPKGN